mmetsp:Transcript_30042/g.50805  ORF Transcript_30042/g.50805 Transcript_30042/m.50805 type:complete len:378 (+) Transcript_30042:49-1182(+)
MKSTTQKRKSSEISNNNTAGRNRVTVAYQGQPGSFTYLGTRKFFAVHEDRCEYISTQSLKEAISVLTNINADYAVVPLETSSHGTIHGVYDTLLASEGSAFIVGEIGQLEEHCLCINKSHTTQVSDTDITEVLCHPHILDCCSDYLDAVDSKRLSHGRNKLVRTPTWDSAAACTRVATSTTGNTHPLIAAIGSKVAAELHSLKIVKQGVGNDRNAETRYVVVARRDPTSGTMHDPLGIAPTPVTADGVTSVNAQSSTSMNSAHKASIALGLKNIPGALFKMSSCFALRDMNITKIESRPSTIANRLTEARSFTKKHWDLLYYIDYEPSPSPAVNRALLENLKEFCLWIRELGYYAPGLHAIEAVPSEWNDIVDVVCF